jgi:gas vesicle protein
MNKGRTLFFGALLGASAGLVAASLLNRRAEKENRSTAITAGEGLKIGVLLLGLLRAIGSLADDAPKK